MDLSYDILLKVVGGLVGVYLLLSLFNVSGLTRIRTVSTLLIGIILVGWLGWPLVRPADPLGAITLVDGNLTIVKILILCALSFAAGLISYLTSWPNGTLTAPLAAPAGMAVWVFASGDMRTLLLYNSTLAERQKVYASLGWEGLFWLLPVLAGLLGVLCGWAIQNRGKFSGFSLTSLTADGKPFWLAVSIAGTVIIAQILINIPAQDVRQADTQLGHVIGQPGKGQIAFAVFITFLIAAMAVKYFAKTGYLIPTLCAAVVVYLAMRYAASPTILENMTRNWSVAYFPKAICAILPLQMVTFGALGAFAGYQSAIKLLDSQKQA
jgi:hypothetical protein